MLDAHLYLLPLIWWGVSMDYGGVVSYLRLYCTLLPHVSADTGQHTLADITRDIAHHTCKQNLHRTPVM